MNKILQGKKYNASFEAQKLIAQNISDDDDVDDEENDEENDVEDESASSLRERIERSIRKERNKYYQKMLFES